LMARRRRLMARRRRWWRSRLKMSQQGGCRLPTRWWRSMTRRMEVDNKEDHSMDYISLVSWVWQLLKKLSIFSVISLCLLQTWQTHTGSDVSKFCSCDTIYVYMIWTRVGGGSPCLGCMQQWVWSGFFSWMGQFSLAVEAGASGCCHCTLCLPSV